MCTVPHPSLHPWVSRQGGRRWRGTPPRCAPSPRPKSMYLYIIHMCVYIYITYTYIYIYIYICIYIQKQRASKIGLRLLDLNVGGAYIFEQSPNRRHRNLKAFEEHIQKQSRFFLFRYIVIFIVFCLG